MSSRAEPGTRVHEMEMAPPAEAGYTLEEIAWSSGGVLRLMMQRMLRRSGVGALDLIKAWDDSGDGQLTEAEFLQKLSGFFGGESLQQLFTREVAPLARKCFRQMANCDAADRLYEVKLDATELERWLRQSVPGYADGDDDAPPPLKRVAKKAKIKTKDAPGNTYYVLQRTPHTRSLPILPMLPMAAAPSLPMELPLLLPAFTAKISSPLTNKDLSPSLPALTAKIAPPPARELPPSLPAFTAKIATMLPELMIEAPLTTSKVRDPRRGAAKVREREANRQRARLRGQIAEWRAEQKVHGQAWVAMRGLT